MERPGKDVVSEPIPVSYFDYSRWYSGSYSISYSGSFSDSYSDWYSGSYPGSSAYSHLDLHVALDSVTEQSDESESTPSGWIYSGRTDGNMARTVNTSTVGPYYPGGTAALKVALLSVAAMFALILIVCFILHWKRSHKRRRSTSSSNSLNKDLEKDREVGNSEDQIPVDMSVTSCSHCRYPSSDVEKNKDCYAEVDETSTPIAQRNLSRNPEGSPSDSYEDNGRGTVEYKENSIPNSRMDDGFQDTESGDAQSSQGYEITKTVSQNDAGFETASVGDQLCKTVNSVTPSMYSYAHLSARQRDGGYDSLNRQQNSNAAKSKIDSGYDVTERSQKGDVKFVLGNQIESDFLVLTRSSTSGYDNFEKLDKMRSKKVGNISPSDYDILSP